MINYKNQWTLSSEYSKYEGDTSDHGEKKRKERNEAEEEVSGEVKR